MDRQRTLRTLASAVAALTLLLAGACACRAQTTFAVGLDTSSLVGSPNGPFSLDFQFTDGSGTGDGNNTVTLSHFNFGSGAATGTPNTTGYATGDLTSGISLTDTSFFNELYQTFTPGNTLSFDLTLTDNADVGATPDEFAFAILDGNLNNLPTTDPGGAFVVADLTGQGIAIAGFGGVAPYGSIPAPSGVPEPGALPLLGAVLGAGTLLLRRRHR